MSQVFEIVVRGRISPDLVAALDGFDIETNSGGLSHIVGSVPDQPRLLGILAAFDDLHVELVSVSQVAR